MACLVCLSADLRTPEPQGFDRFMTCRSVRTSSEEVSSAKPLKLEIKQLIQVHARERYGDCLQLAFKIKINIVKIKRLSGARPFITQHTSSRDLPKKGLHIKFHPATPPESKPSEQRYL
jgi:hypothetical protein